LFLFEFADGGKVKGILYKIDLLERFLANGVLELLINLWIFTADE